MRLILDIPFLGSGRPVTRQGSRGAGSMSTAGYPDIGVFQAKTTYTACVKHSPLLSRAKHKAAAVEIPCHGTGLQAGATCAFYGQKTCPPGSSVLSCCLSYCAPTPATAAASLVPLPTHATGFRHLFSNVLKPHFQSILP